MPNEISQNLKIIHSFQQYSENYELGIVRKSFFLYDVALNIDGDMIDDSVILKHRTEW